jgi:hypothetical protein
MLLLSVHGFGLYHAHPRHQLYPLRLFTPLAQSALAKLEKHMTKKLEQ